jgi:ribosomal protein S19
MSAPNVVFIESHTRNSRRFADLEIDAQSIGKLLRHFAIGSTRSVHRRSSLGTALRPDFIPSTLQQ